MYKDIVNHIKSIYHSNDFIPLHEPRFVGNEKKYLGECIDSTFVSSIGKFVGQFEDKIAKFTGAKYAIATVNGTAAVHMALLLADVRGSNEVITQPLTFVATTNAIAYTGAKPVFIDVDKETMGLSPQKLKDFFAKETIIKNGVCINKKTRATIKACIPMHTFGHPCRIDDIKEICDINNVVLIEDAAESLGSWYKDKHTGTFGKMGTLSFNGNKTITTGGGGMIITNDEFIAKKAKHLTTTAKIPHKWEFMHDETGYNYRLTNLAAALGCAQMEQLPVFLESKRNLANKYAVFFKKKEMNFFLEPKYSKSNYWLNCLILKNGKEREEFLEYTNEHGVMTRPIWKLMNKLPMFDKFECNDLENAEWLEKRVVNIPSSVVI